MKVIILSYIILFLLNPGVPVRRESIVSVYEKGGTKYGSAFYSILILQIT
jgi:hypothetical protein